MFPRCYQIVRGIHQKCVLMAKMPGVRLQLGALENAEDLADDPAALDDLEADFNYSKEMEIKHEKELAAQRERIRHLIVKHKYFRDEHLPNMLLYAEKEEIRNLHARDPEEWTVDRLAESFPATPEIVKKILKSKWRPYSAKRIRAHDEAVLRNWERLKASKEDDDDDDTFLPPEMRAHFSKFASRIIKNSATDYIKSQLRPKLPTPKGNEFASIITSCKKYATDDNTKEHGNGMNISTRMKVPEPENETYLLGEVQDKRNMRLEDWKKQKMGQFAQLLGDGGGIIPKTTDGGDENTQIIAPENPGCIEKFQSNEILITAEDSKRYEISTYKERIHIPRKLYRKGGTYRVEDCYYDDDGEFLFRVPGMYKAHKGVDS